MQNLDHHKRKPDFPESLRGEGIAREEQDAMWQVLEEWDPGEPSADFDDAVMARIQAEDAGESRRSTSLHTGFSANAGVFAVLWQWFHAVATPRGLAMAGALATLVIAMVVLRSPDNPSIDTNPVPVTMDISAQQVEMALEDLQLLDELYSPPAIEDTQSNKL
jgi:hypothetical protein